MSSPVRRPSRVDELLEAIDQATKGLRSSKGLRAHYPKAYAELEARNEAARTVVLAASYEAAVTRLAVRRRPTTFAVDDVLEAGYDLVEHRTRRPLDNEVAEVALEALGRAYGVPQ